MNYLNGLQVLVLGLGESGLAMARWCARCGAQVRVWDSREDAPNAAALTEHVPAAELLRGALTDAAFAGVKLVLKSPGLSPTDERIAAPLARAADMGVLVQGELDLFARALADLKVDRGYAPKVLAITGTNGKTTTTAMTAMLVARTGKRVAMAGNIGPTMLQTLADALVLEPAASVAVEALFDVVAALPGPHPNRLPEAEGDTPAGEGATSEGEGVAPEVEGATSGVGVDTPPDASDDDGDAQLPSPSGRGIEGEGDDAMQPLIILPPPPPTAPTFEHLPEVWVLELSSFQLDEVKGFEPSAATVLNITQDHLDWHGSMAAYTAAKARVFGKRSVMVVNRDDALVEKLVPAPEVVKGLKGKRSTTIERTVLRFGTGAPLRPGDFGIVEENGMAWLVRATEVDETIKRPRLAKGAVAEPDEIFLQRLMPADALRVRGRHNVANALAALALATAIGCPLAPMLHGLREYTGEPHRVQFIATINAVDAFDDSKGTNVGATVAALLGLGADKAPAKLVVILGGDGKGQDFTPLADGVRRHVRAVALIGRDAGRIEQALASTGVTLQRFETLQAATRWCFERAHPGDAVLLSPACASLDMFRNYGHRAEVFVAEVHAIAADAGGVAA
jgi:UDP-N-acetylmuramoylalanine--D-glutamate ligase